MASQPLASKERLQDKPNEGLQRTQELGLIRNDRLTGKSTLYRTMCVGRRTSSWCPEEFPKCSNNHDEGCM